MRLIGGIAMGMLALPSTNSITTHIEELQNKIIKIVIIYTQYFHLLLLFYLKIYKQYQKQQIK